MLDDNHLLSIRQLSCARQQQTLFANLTLQLAPGDLLIVEGPNGSGKSSLLRILAGLASPSGGDMYWHGVSTTSQRQAFHADMHYVGHANGIKSGLSVTENLRLMQHLAGINPDENNDGILTSLQLQHHRHTLACHLSAGQRRRLALARLLLLRKKLWILDEPLTALDMDTQTFFIDQLQHHLQSGGMAIISTHHIIPLQYRSMKKLRLPLC